MWQPTPGIALTLFEYAPEAILIVDYQDRRFLACNQKAQELLGYAAEELLALSPGALSPQRQVNGMLSAELIERDIQIATRKGSHVFDWMHKHKSGQLIPTEVRLLRLPDVGHPEKAIFRVSIIDLRPGFEAERKLSEREAYLTRILESPGLIVFSLDRQYCYTAFNSLHATVMKTIWGVSIHTGLSMLDCISNEKDRAKARTNFDRALAGEEFTVVEEFGDEERLRTWYEDFYSPQRSLDGTIEGITVFVKDITSQKRYEDRLAQQNAQLLQVNEELNTLVYHTSHDLRAPIASLQGLVSLLNIATETEQVKYKELINTQLMRLDRIIQDIIDLRRISTSELNPGRVMLHPFVQEIVEVTRFHSGNNYLSIHIEGPSDISISTDRYYLQIIISNLISNAFKYQDPNRKVPSLRIVFVPQPDGVTISVEDNGIGIPPIYQSRIFEMFFRATTQGSGTGIGLYIVKGALDRLGGRIRLSSVEGEGSTFEVYIPNQASI